MTVFPVGAEKKVILDRLVCRDRASAGPDRPDDKVSMV
jgi:hypothetical protein